MAKSSQSMSDQQLNLRIEKPGVYYTSPMSGIKIQKYTQFLEQVCKLENRNSARICFHKDHQSPLMSMLVYNTNHFTYPLHRHRNKFESYNIIQGRCIFETFDTYGKSLKSVLLSDGDFLHNESHDFHVIRPLTRSLTFIEHTIGPFDENSNEYFE